MKALVVGERMQNQVFVRKDGLIFCVYDGSQTAESLGLMVRETEKISSQLRKENKPVLILVDMTRFGNASIDARATAASALERNTYDKVAIFGANRFLRHVSNLLIFATRKSDIVRHFESEEHAKKWLLSEK